MHETALGLAIRKPAELARLEFETNPETGINLADHIRDEALQGGEDMLPLLEFLLSELYEEQHAKRNDGLLSWAAYRRLGGTSTEAQKVIEQPPDGNSGKQSGFIAKLLRRIGLEKKAPKQPAQPVLQEKFFVSGGLAGAVSQHANKLLLKCSQAERDVLPKVLLQLVRLSDDGNQVQRQRARVQIFLADPNQASLVNKLINGRLLISHFDANTQEAAVELVHDCLLTVWAEVNSVVQQYKLLFEEKRKLINAALHWSIAGRPRNKLLNNSREVINGEIIIQNMVINDMTVKAFLEQSVKYSRSGLFLFWILILIIIGFFFLECLKKIEIESLNFGNLIWLLLLFFMMLIFMLPAIWNLFRGLYPRPYLSTAKADQIFFSSYLLYLIVAEPFFFGKNFLNHQGELEVGPTTTFAIYIFLIFIIPILTFSKIYKIYKFVTLAKKNNPLEIYGGLSSRPMISFLPSNVVIWSKAQMILFIISIVFFIFSLGEFQREKKLKENTEQYAILFAESLQNDASTLISQKNNKRAIELLNLAKNITAFFAYNKSYIQDKFLIDEVAALDYVNIYVNNCKLHREAEEFSRCENDCKLLENISRHWMEISVLHKVEWKNFLAIALSQLALNLSKSPLEPGENVKYRTDRALKYLSEGLELFEVLQSASDSKDVYKRNYSKTLKRVGDVYLSHNDSFKLALDYYEKSWKILKRLFGKEDNLLYIQDALELYDISKQEATKHEEYKVFNKEIHLSLTHEVEMSLEQERRNSWLNTILLKLNNES